MTPGSFPSGVIPHSYYGDTSYWHPLNSASPPPALTVHVPTDCRKMLDLCYKILEEVRRGMEKQRRVKEDIRNVGQSVRWR